MSLYPDSKAGRAEEIKHYAQLDRDARLARQIDDRVAELMSKDGLYDPEHAGNMAAALQEFGDALEKMVEMVNDGRVVEVPNYIRHVSRLYWEAEAIRKAEQELGL